MEKAVRQYGRHDAFPLAQPRPTWTGAVMNWPPAIEDAPSWELVRLAG